MKPRLLDLFCGAGGAAMGYHRAGFEVVGVDNKPQPHFPFEFHQADALEVMAILLAGEPIKIESMLLNGNVVNDAQGHNLYLKDIDAFHASPPCQKYTTMQHRYKNKLNHPDLIDPIRERLLLASKPFVIENVNKAPLRGHLMLCGTMFGLKVAHHRFFECDFMPLELMPPCNHKGVYSRWDWKNGNRQEREKLLDALNINWHMTLLEVREAIPPAYTEYIGKYLINFTQEGNDGHL